jgi:signal transduction histidine kinase
MLGKSKDLERELIFCQAKIEFLEQQLEQSRIDKDELKQQVARLQESLFSVRAPEAYQDHVNREYDKNMSVVTAEDKERNRIAREVTASYLQQLEGPLFKSGEDLDDLLAESLLRHAQPAASLHENSES